MTAPTTIDVGERFQEAVLAGDLASLAELMADDVTLLSPVMPRPYEGKEAVLALMEVLERAFADFRYVGAALRGTADDGEHRVALFFDARADDARVDGVDVLRIRDGLVREIAVYARPLPSTMSLARAVSRARGEGG